VRSILRGGKTVIAWPPTTRRVKIGTIGAPVSRAIRTAPGGRVVSRPKNDTDFPFKK
jgi:hypothetical protein